MSRMWGIMGAEEGRRVRALLSVIEKPVDELAEEWDVDRKRLIGIMYGRVPLADDITALIAKRLGVSTEWLGAGRGPIFTGRSPGRNVESAIERQLRFGPPRVGGVPLFEGVAEVMLDRPTKDGWLEYARRGVMPAAAVQREGFYVAVDEDEARIAGCTPGDMVLFLPAKRMLKPTKIGEGEKVVCILKCRTGQKLRQLEVLSIEHSAKRAGAEEPATGPPKCDIEFAGKHRYLLACADSGAGSMADSTITAVAVRAERDLVTRSSAP